MKKITVNEYLGSSIKIPLEKNTTAAFSTFFFLKKKSRINWKMNFPFHSNFHIPECAHHKHATC